MKSEILRTINLSKDLLGSESLNNFNFELYQGEILGLVGDNVSGKTLLTKILSGELSQDSGKIYLNERLVTPKALLDSNSDGICCINHSVSFFPDLSLEENICLLPLKRFKGQNYWQRCQSVNKILNEFGISATAHTKMSELSVLHQHIVMLIKAAVREPKIIILGNISSYSETDFHHLLEVIYKLRDEGISFIVVESQPEIVLDFADRVVLIRDGRNAGTFFKDEFDKERIQKILVGNIYLDYIIQKSQKTEDVLFEVRSLSYENIKNLNFKTNAGEVVGFLDINDGFFSKVLKILSGQITPESKEILLHGKTINVTDPCSAIKNKICYSDGNTHKNLFWDLNILENLTIPFLKTCCNKLGIINTRMLRLIEKQYVKKLSLQSENLKGSIAKLDNLDKEKISMYRSSIFNAKVLLFDNPFRGKDASTKQAIYQIIQKAVEKSATTIICSVRLSDLINICDRICIFKNNTITAQINSSEFLSTDFTRFFY